MNDRSAGRLCLGFAGLLLALVGAACSSSTDATPSGSGFGCCPLPDRPTGSCSLVLGGAKSSAADNCVGLSDGRIPDTTAPGWTVVNDADGCPAWTPPPNVPYLACGGQFDAGRSLDAGDAGDGGD